MRLAGASVILVWLGSLALASGCIELQALLTGHWPPIDGTPGDGGPNGPPNGDGNTQLAVSLSVSNPTPQLNEEVFLTCEVIRGDTEGVVFDFQPAGGRLVVDRARGVASFIVQETDVGQSYTFTCSARNALGETATSSPRIVTPTS